MVAGHLVSGYVKQHLPILLVNHLSDGEDVGNGLSNGARQPRSCATFLLQALAQSQLCCLCLDLPTCSCIGHC